MSKPGGLITTVQDSVTKKYQVRIIGTNHGKTVIQQASRSGICGAPAVAQNVEVKSPCSLTQFVVMSNPQVLSHAAFNLNWIMSLLKKRLLADVRPARTYQNASQQFAAAADTDGDKAQALITFQSEWKAAEG